MVGVLPLFHSFGYMATLWFPLLGGVKVAYHRSPLEADMVERLIKKENGTIVLITPTILSMWAKKFDPESVKSVRFFLTGAEKLREGQREEVEKKFGTVVLEGYGCTELSPVACVSAMNVKDRHEFQEGNKPGKVGRPLPGVSIHITDPETGALRGYNETGLILVKGPNVMKGYWAMPEKTAEAVQDGWYVTGDIGAVDEEGFVEITDRLSRFSKIAGEMVPHMLLEEKLSALCGDPELKFFVTAVPDPKKGEALVVLHHGGEVNAADLTGKLAKAGLPPLWVPEKRLFFALDEWPLLGSGKVDIGKARKIALEKSGRV
jgi:acyl-[acyl-carrier-protein]-phospholipid O-acyltransferase/long-chain-fatty-acid--[acyl-carrier-protein] ligase